MPDASQMLSQQLELRLELDFGKQFLTHRAHQHYPPFLDQLSKLVRLRVIDSLPLVQQLVLQQSEFWFRRQ